MLSRLSKGISSFFSSKPQAKKGKVSAKTSPKKAKNGAASRPRATPLPTTPEREALIRHALAVHRSKQYILQDLTPEQRQGLIDMAYQMLVPPEAPKEPVMLTPEQRKRLR
jgi:hypothetical protein